MTLQITSTAFRNGETIPKPHTGDRKNVSPPLQWSEPPAGTNCFALICEDPDAPRGTWTHWVVFNLPADSRGFDEGARVSGGAIEGKNDFGKTGYGGPAPPPGKPHRYYFRIYALDTVLNLKEGATKQQVDAAMKGHVLGKGELMGKYSR